MNPAARPFLGYWKITEMEVWGSDYVDLIVPGFIEFEHPGDEDEHIMGGFQFGTVSGGLHAHTRTVADELFIEWSWEGRSDNDPGCGRGWAQVVSGELVGRIFIHLSDDSAFRAKRGNRPPCIWLPDS